MHYQYLFQLSHLKAWNLSVLWSFPAWQFLLFAKMYIVLILKLLCLHDYLLQGLFSLPIHLFLTISAASNALAFLFIHHPHSCCSQYPFHLQNRLLLTHILYSTQVSISLLNSLHQHRICNLFLYTQCLLFFFQFHHLLAYEGNLNEVLSMVQEFLYLNFQEPLLNLRHTNIHFQW